MSQHPNREKSLQETFAPTSQCYGCGPGNPKGLHVRSIAPKEGDASDGTEVVAVWTPEKFHEAFPGVLNGGVIGSLLDCHSNWTAAFHLMKKTGVDHPPCTVTADYSVKLLRPTPTNGDIEIRAWVAPPQPDSTGKTESRSDRAVIEAKLIAGGKVCATCRGTFVAVGPGHPAYYRW